jgi:uncharacterized protein YlzI (FlbEa/FlbD family)
MWEVLALQQYLVLQTIDGRSVFVNPAQITNMVEQTGKGVVVGSVHCVIFLTDGKFLSVTETCESIQKRLSEIRKLK